MKIGIFEVSEPVPDLQNTRALAILRPWIDVGRVGSVALSQVERYMAAKELGRLDRPGTYFDFTRYRPRTRTVGERRILTTPNTVVYYARIENGGDFLFLHVREPHSMAEEYVEGIVDLLDHFNVVEYCRIGGMYDSVPHTRPLLVTGSLSEDQVRKAGDTVSTRGSNYQGPTSIVNLVTQSLEEKGIATPSLMAHIPQYVQLDEDHMGASRLMEVLCAMYDLPKFLAETNRGERQYSELSRAIESNSEVSTLIKQLEAYYDRTQAAPSTSEEVGPELSPDIEAFLEQASERLNNEEED